MSGFDRGALLEKFQDMKRRRIPIIGGGAGTGLSAKCEEAGGIDLIVIYNSGRYRMAGRGSLSGLLAFGNANEIVMEMAKEILPVVRKTPVLAGVNGTDPFCIFDRFLDEVKAAGFAGVQNFPTVGLIDGVFRRNLEATGMSYDLEVEMIRLARRKNLLTTPYVFSAADAAKMAEAGADIIVCHMGLTTGGAIGAEVAVKLEDCPASRRSVGRGGARGQQGRDHPRARRAGQRAGGRRIHAQEHQTLRRILRRLVDGAPADRTGADRTDAQVQVGRIRVIGRQGSR